MVIFHETLRHPSLGTCVLTPIFPLPCPIPTTATGCDIVSLDWTVTIPEARKRIGNTIGIQGNLDPYVLHGPAATIKEQTEAILAQGGGRNHVMNLGHGIDATTPEHKAKLFVDTVQAWRQ